MKKNKTVAFMLAATLMVGGTFLGTKAWFTDSTEASNDLVVTMGDLDVNAYINDVGSKDDDGQWNIINEHTELKNDKGEYYISGAQGNDFKNASPRDSFEKTITIRNDGSLKQQITMSDLVGKDKKLPNGVTVELQHKDKVSNVYTKFADTNTSYILEPKAIEEYKIVVKFDGASTGGNYSDEVPSYDGKNPDQTLNTKAVQKFEFSEYFNEITVQADQVNKPKSN